MAQKIEIIITADGKKVKAEVTDVTKGVKGLGDASKQANTGVNTFGKSLGGLVQYAAGPVALTAAMGTLAAGVRKSIELSKEQARVEAQLDAVLTSTGHAAGLSAKEIKSMASALQGTTNYGDEATIAGQNMLLTFTNIGKDVFPRATASMLDLSTAMGQDVKQSAIQIGKALNDPLTGLTNLQRVGIQFTESQKALIKSFVDSGKVAEAQGVILDELERQFGGSAAAAREADAGSIALENSIGDLGEAVGDLIIPFVKLTNESLIPFISKLEEGADTWRWILDAAAALNQQAGGAAGSAAAMQSLDEATHGVVGALNPLVALTANYSRLTAEQTKEALNLAQAREAEADRLSGLAEMYRKQSEAVTQTSEITHEALQSSAELHAMTGAAAAESYREIGEAAMEAAEEARAAQMTLAGSQADFILSFQELQKNMLADEEAFNEQMAGVRSDAATKSKEAAAGLAEELAAIEQDRVDKIKWVRDGAWARTETEEAEAEAYWNAHYEELKNTAVAKTKEKTDAILAEESRATAAQQAAREREKEEYKAHLEELKLQTALSMLETTGQLEQLTGLVGISASDAANLITSGVLPMSQEMGLALQGTMENMESSMAAASETADANQAILQEAFAGTLTGAQNLGAGTTEALLAMGESTTALHQEQTVPYREELELITAETVPALTSVYVSGMDASVAATDRLIAKLPQLETALNKVKTVAAQMTESITSGMNEAASGIDRAAGKIKSKLIPAIHKTTVEMEKLQSIAARTIETLAGAGNMASSATGGAAGFQHGTPPGGFLVPSSFGTDEFLARFSGRERIFAFPNDRVPGRQQTTNYYFNQTINTARYDSGMAAADLRTAQIMLGA